MFSDNMINTMKLMDDPKKFMSGYISKLKNSDIAKGDILKQAQAREAMKPYAEFLCETCGKMFLKEQAIVQQGMCNAPNCNGTIKHVAANKVEEEQDHTEDYECMGCGNKCPCKDIIDNKKMCRKCGSKNFVKVALMEQVVQNTLQMNQSLNLPIIDAEHEKGKVYAYYSYEAEDSDVPVQVVVCADGKFTENDFVHFDISGAAPRAVVATLTNDPLIKFSANESTRCSWVVEDPDEYEFFDVNNRKIIKNSQLEWFVPEGSCYATVKGFTVEGIKVQMNKHPKYGKLKEDDPFGECVISQEYINSSGVNMV